VTGVGYLAGWLWLPVVVAMANGSGTPTSSVNGLFTNHGVAAPFSTHRGIVATQDGQKRNIVLVWLYDHRGCYALLLIDAETGKSEEFPTPFPYGGDAPYASILSSANRLYSHFGSHFVEFDPAKRAFTWRWGWVRCLVRGRPQEA
jgi:hypothetical protein